MKVRAYAKLNLYLKVISECEDGYHFLEMLNTKIDFYDELDIEISNTNKHSVVTNGASIDEENNLVYLALLEIDSIRNIPKISVKIKKNIYSQAGLGGGSTDAAKVIRWVNDTYELSITKKELETISNNIGADIYYCYFDCPMIVKGRGCIVERIPNQEYYVLLINPRINCSTKNVFSELVLNNKISYINKFVDAYQNNDIDGINKYFVNDLEEAAFKVSPELKKFNVKLKEIDDYFKMTGSGSNYYYLSNDLEKLKQLLEKVEKLDCDCFITKTI